MQLNIFHYLARILELSKSKDYKFSKEIANMELSIAQNIHPNGDPDAFALGKVYESNKQFDKSFEHYAEGNCLL